MVSLEPARYTNTTPEPRRLITSRYERFKAEHVMMPFSPASRRSSTHLATFSSHGARSSSVSGRPASIFSTFDRGCSASPSSNRQTRRPARIAATVVFPQPDTPMKTRTTGFAIGVEIEECRSSRMFVVMLGAFSWYWSIVSEDDCAVAAPKGKAGVGCATSPPLNFLEHALA